MVNKTGSTVVSNKINKYSYIKRIHSFRTNKIFNGKIYAKDNPNSCVVDIEDKIEFSIKMGYNDIECNVKRKSQGFYSNEVIIQVSYQFN